jgi:hypothetical protein
MREWQHFYKRLSGLSSGFPFSSYKAVYTELYPSALSLGAINQLRELIILLFIYSLFFFFFFFSCHSFIGLCEIACRGAHSYDALECRLLQGGGVARGGSGWLGVAPGDSGWLRVAPGGSGWKGS